MSLGLCKLDGRSDASLRTDSETPFYLVS
jgi:hypothetical protein